MANIKITDPILFTAMQYLLSVFPELSEKKALAWLKKLPPEKQVEISKIIFNGHNDHNELGNMSDLRGNYLFSVDLPLSAARDIIRHRAVGRNLDIFNNDTNPYLLLNNGFVKNYSLFNTKGRKFNKLQDEWIEDATNLYDEIRDLIYSVQKALPKSGSSWLLRVLPLGHMSNLQLTLPINQFVYLIALREKRGGDYEYVNIANLMMEQLRELNPKAKGILRKSRKLKPNSINEFKTRS